MPIINGTNGNDTLLGTVDDDTINALDGDDNIDGGLGNDVIDGGAGSDTVSYLSASGPVTVNFSSTSGNGFSSGAAGDDFLIGVENVVGSNFDDAISGSSLDNILDGAGGNDTILGRLGNDIIFGGSGNDNLYGQQGDDQLLGGDGNDFMRGGTGDDLLNGGSGFDRVSFFPTGTDTITGGVTVSLLLQGAAQNTGQGMDTLSGVEALSGTPFNDSLTGDNNINWLVASDFDGAGGDDQLYGLGGNDLLEVAGGNHIIDGGTDVDTLSFNGLGYTTGAVSVSLALQGAPQTTGIGSMTISNVENLSGSTFDDILTGDGNANGLYGAAGNDTLVGGAGDDLLYGDGSVRAYDLTGPISPTFFADVATLGEVSGNDTLEGGLGNDFLDGGAGIDTASYANASGSVTVSLGTVVGTSQGADGNDQLRNIENILGSAFNDRLTGNNADNMLDGGAGHDQLYGRGGADTLLGGTGDDFLRGTEGDDIMDGGSGFDRVSNFVVAPTIGVVIDLNIQGVAQNTNYGMDILIGIEHASGTILSDVLTGNGGDNWLWDGGDGDETTIGSGNDVISAGAGNDLVEVGNGNHSLSGGTGTDTLSFLGGQTETTVAGVTFSLALQGAAQATEQGSMTASGFENVSGSIYDDVLTGDGFANVLLGDWGADVLNGGDGNDTLYGDGRLHIDVHGTGGSGPITLFGDAEAAFAGGLGVDGNDTLNGGKGDDFLYGGRGDDVLTGGQGADVFVIEGLSGDDRITDFKAVDTIRFDAASGVDAFSDLTLTLIGGDTLITWGTTDSLLIEGVKPNKLDASDFSFGSPAAASSSRLAMDAPDHGSNYHSATFNFEAADHGLLIG